jgi:hypothetical protein
MTGPTLNVSPARAAAASAIVTAMTMMYGFICVASRTAERVYTGPASVKPFGVPRVGLTPVARGWLFR